MGRFCVDVSALLGEVGSILEVDDDVPLEELTAGDTQLTFRQRPHVNAILTHTDIGVVLTGTVSAHAHAECSRCLEPFVLMLEGSLEGGFTEHGAEVVEDGIEEWLPIEGESVDLMPAIEAALRVETPFAPVHDETCRGICPLCGCDLNQEPCGCMAGEEDEPTGPFAALKDLAPPVERE